MKKLKNKTHLRKFIRSLSFISGKNILFFSDGGWVYMDGDIKSVESYPENCGYVSGIHWLRYSNRPPHRCITLFLRDIEKAVNELPLTKNSNKTVYTYKTPGSIFQYTVTKKSKK